MTTTVNDVISANAALESAFTNLAAIQAVAKPKGYGGMSFALEEANDDGQQEAKKGIFQKLKELIKRFFDFILGRKKKTEDKVDEILDKADASEEAFKKFIDEFSKPMADFPMQNSKGSQADYDAIKNLIAQKVASHKADIEKILADEIANRCDDSQVWRVCATGGKWGVSDMQKLVQSGIALKGLADQVRGLIKSLENALGTGDVAALKAVGDEIHALDLKHVEPLPEKASFHGSPAGVCKASEETIKKLREILKAVRSERSSEGVEHAFKQAADKATRDNDTEYAAALNHCLNWNISSLSLTETRIITRLSMMITNVSLLSSIVIAASNSDEARKIEEAILNENPQIGEVYGNFRVVQFQIEKLISEII